MRLAERQLSSAAIERLALRQLLHDYTGLSPVQSARRWIELHRNSTSIVVPEGNDCRVPRRTPPLPGKGLYPLTLGLRVFVHGPREDEITLLILHRIRVGNYPSHRVLPITCRRLGSGELSRINNTRGVLQNACKVAFRTSQSLHLRKKTGFEGEAPPGASHRYC